MPHFPQQHEAESSAAHDVMAALSPHSQHQRRRQEEQQQQHSSLAIRAGSSSTALFPEHTRETTAAASPAATSPSRLQEQSQSVPRRIRIKNRRKRYLDLHPGYFTSAERELTDPLLYDMLIRRHLSAQERETLGRERGFTGILEADLQRSEAKLQALEQKRGEREAAVARRRKGEMEERCRRQRARLEEVGRLEEEDEVGKEEEEKEEYGDLTKDEAFRLWKDIMTQRFLSGEDRDFEYEQLVDENEGLDDWEEEERGRLEEWLGEEEPEFLLDDGEGGEFGGGDTQRVRKELEGETGVQDF